MKYSLVFIIIFLSGCSSFNTIQVYPNLINKNNEQIAEVRVELSHARLGNTPWLGSTHVEINPCMKVTVGDISLNSCGSTSKYLEKNTDIINKHVCSIKIPVFSKTPEVPLKEMKKISPDDTIALSSLEAKHIKELHAYISELKKSVMEDYNANLSICSSDR